jgi:sugar phosphate isomerase/epimerase
MTRGQVLPSTTSHKHEALIPTLELFARLGFTDLDLNLNHIVEGRATVAEVRSALVANGQRARIVSGGWCDFFDAEPEYSSTLDSVEYQVDLAKRFGVDRMRLFFGRLPTARWSPEARTSIVANIAGLADRHPEMHFWFENHDGASSRPEICRTILDDVARANVRLVFDPINFEHRGVAAMDALREIRPHVAHVHLKGYAKGEFCGFGEGDVDLAPALEALVGSGYAGAFTVEYEGSGDRSLRLYQSVGRARDAVAALLDAAPSSRGA